ncbi:MAG: VanZ family protein [Lachnospiraceae bacterium]|nr:VanZ family protein [Lachnospiraceae bacterium]
MIKYLLQFIIIILIILPFYLALRKPWQREREREIALAVFVLFMIGLLALALQGRYQMPLRMLASARERINTGVGINLVPFRSIQAYFVHYGLDGFLVNFVGNIVMFVPWGFGLTLLWKKNQRIWIIALYSLGLTVMIETIQLFIGRSVDVDDLILNFTGSCLGAGVCHILRKKFPRLNELSM